MKYVDCYDTSHILQYRECVCECHLCRAVLEEGEEPVEGNHIKIVQQGAQLVQSNRMRHFLI